MPLILMPCKLSSSQDATIYWYDLNHIFAHMGPEPVKGYTNHLGYGMMLSGLGLWPNVWGAVGYGAPGPGLEQEGI
jgi:hypothetical protein